MALLLAEELLLLRPPNVVFIYLGPGLAGALLADLALDGRLSCPGKVTVNDRAPTGHPVLDRVLDEIAVSWKARSAAGWVAVLQRWDLEKRLKAARAATGTTPDPESGAEIAERLSEMFTTAAEPDPRTAALAALVSACRVSAAVFSAVDPSLRESRLAELSAGQWPASAVRTAIRRSKRRQVAGGLVSLLGIPN